MVPQWRSLLALCFTWGLLLPSQVPMGLSQGLSWPLVLLRPHWQACLLHGLHPQVPLLTRLMWQHRVQARVLLVAGAGVVDVALAGAEVVEDVAVVSGRRLPQGRFPVRIFSSQECRVFSFWLSLINTIICHGALITSHCYKSIS